MSVSVIQVGARHNYAIPRMLHAEGLFSELMTDFCGLPSVVRQLGPAVKMLPSPLKRLIGRLPEGVPSERIHTALQTTFLEFLALKGFTKDHWDLDGRIYRSFESACFECGLTQAKVLYAMLFEASPSFLRQASERGQKLILDVYITPLWHRIVSAEREKFPDWDGTEPILRPAFEQRVREQAEVVDILLCPSESVARDMREFVPEHAAKIRVLPYGCGASFGGNTNVEQRGRLLFSGSAGLRKGLQYLAKAASLLRAKGRDYDFIVAGGVTDTIRKLPACKDLNFVGRLPRAEMLQEFLDADLMVFPSLAEGCAGSVHEALLAGLPVIATASAGSILTDGIGGRIVPECDPQALADAIENTVEDRLLRNSLAESTAEYSDFLSEKTWQRKLCGIVEGLSPVCGFDSQR